MFTYIGFDDTDTLDADYGTGKLARWFEKELSNGYLFRGVVRQQLLVHEKIPYTSHNSAACVVLDIPDLSGKEDIVEKATAHIERFSLEGSDPGLCVVCENDPSIGRLIDFGLTCTREVVTQRDAMEAASHVHLSSHGGTSDGIIGAAAAVGLTAYGWSGRFIEFGRLRHFPEIVRVSELERANITVVSLDRDSKIPAPEDIVYTNGWLRPRLLGTKAVLCVVPMRNGVWKSLGEKRKKKEQDDHRPGTGARHGR